MNQPNPDGRLPWHFFFPEVLGFAGIVLLSPLWTVRLIQQSNYIQAFVVATSSITAGIVFVWFLRKGRRWSAWLTMVAFFLLLLALDIGKPIR